MENVIDVANYIMKQYKRITGDYIDEMKLHKLLYFAQRESFAITGERLFDGDFEGWSYGPVCCDVRGVYDKNGLQTNTNPISDECAYIVNNIIWDYGQFSSWILSRMSHDEISWRNARQGLKARDPGHKKLSIEDIKKDAEKVRPFDSVWGMYYDEFEDATPEDLKELGLGGE